MRRGSDGLPEMPLGPGNAKASRPPRRSEAGGARPSWLRGDSAAWPKSRVRAADVNRTWTRKS
jgi:hypothetical protein